MSGGAPPEAVTSTRNHGKRGASYKATSLSLSSDRPNFVHSSTNRHRHRQTVIEGTRRFGLFSTSFHTNSFIINTRCLEGQLDTASARTSFITLYDCSTAPALANMPLDTSTYSLALLRLDGRRWNELRRINAQISTQSSADGSSYLEIGNTKILVSVTGPSEGRQAGQRGGSGNTAKIEVEINVAGFSGTDRRRKVAGGGDKRIKEMEHCIKSAFEGIVRGDLFPHSTIGINVHVISQDGSLLAACINASTLALIDAGIPMTDYLVACTAASSASSSAADNASADDPLLDLNTLEEQELPFLTVATLGDSEKVAVCVLETRVRMERVEGMLAVGMEGCKRMKGILDDVVKGYGKRFG